MKLDYFPFAVFTVRTKERRNHNREIAKVKGCEKNTSNILPGKKINFIYIYKVLLLQSLRPNLIFCLFAGNLKTK